jgi:hypothetical protein
MADFDQTGRYLIKRRPEGFYRYLSQQFVQAWEWRGWIDTSTLVFPGEPERICDTVAEFVHRTDRNRRLLLDTEVQPRPDPDMLDRMGEYGFRLRRERRYGRGRRGKYQIVGVVLNLTGPVQAHVLDTSEATLGDSGFRLQVFQRTFRDENAAGTLARIASGELERCVLPWVVLMRGAGQADNIREWLRLARQETDERWRSDLGALARIFSGLTRSQETWRVALEGWNMERSEAVLEWEARGEQRTILKFLQAKFGEPVPADITTALAKLTPSERQLWVRQLATSPSIETFRVNVGLPTP